MEKYNLYITRENSRVQYWLDDADTLESAELKLQDLEYISNTRYKGLLNLAYFYQSKWFFIIQDEKGIIRSKLAKLTKIDLQTYFTKRIKIDNKRKIKDAVFDELVDGMDINDVDYLIRQKTNEHIERAKKRALKLKGE